MSTPRLSVVIPTRDRLDRLRQTLQAVLEQGRELGLEIVVVDDGSRQDLGPLAAELGPAPGGVPLRFERQAPRGPAAARNRGVALARAPRVLFLGDDTRPAPGALEEHLDLADLFGRGGEPVGVQGHIDWDPRQPITELMRFLAPAGPQFYFKGLEAHRPVPFTAVLGSNLSVPTRWLREEPFDESFPYAAVEDTEAAWRWRRRGWRVLYAPGAVCWHHHLYDRLDSFLDRQRRAGASLRHAVRRHPRLLPRLVLQPAAMGLVVLVRRRLGRGRRHDSWDLLCRRALLDGFLRPALARGPSGPPGERSPPARR